jgi:hypothetical protein
MGVGAAVHEDQAAQMSFVEGLSTLSGTRLLHLTMKDRGDPQRSLLSLVQGSLVSLLQRL